MVDMTTVSGIGPNEAHLHHVAIADLRDPQLLSAYERLMTPDEAAQRSRFVFEKNQHEYLLTRALVRTTLSRYAPVPPEAWRFVRNKWGRPEISEPALDAPLRFNLSNTEGLVACLVTLGHDAGVDVEWVHRRGETVEVADRFFSPAEVDELHGVAPAQRKDRFFHYWTLKEAYIKARGMGLAIPLDQFSFRLGRAPMEGGIAVSFDARLGDDPGAWQFHLWRPSEGHMMAAAVKKGHGPDLRFTVQACTPLCA